MKEYHINFYLERLRKSRRIAAFLLTLSFLAILMACATEMTSGVRSFFDELEENAKEYNALLRSNQFDKARLYVTKSLWEEFDTRAKGVKIKDCRLHNLDFREYNKGVQVVTVEIDYSITPSSEVRTVLDNQSWNYISPKGEKRKTWTLMTPLPVFK